jgi:hypothetical protein
MRKRGGRQGKRERGEGEREKGERERERERREGGERTSVEEGGAKLGRHDSYFFHVFFFGVIVGHPMSSHSCVLVDSLL